MNEGPDLSLPIDMSHFYKMQEEKLKAGEPIHIDQGPYVKAMADLIALYKQALDAQMSCEITQALEKKFLECLKLYGGMICYFGDPAQLA